MNVYVDNVLGNALTLSAENMAPLYIADLLHDEVLSNNVLFDGTNTVISATWGLNQFADAVAVLDSNWTDGRLAVKSQSTSVFNRRITRHGKHTVIKLPEACMVTELTLELNAFDALEVGIVFVGLRTELPLFNAGVKYNLTINGTADRTRYGIPYGIKRPSLRSFDVSFSDINKSRKRVMEKYIDWVQYVQPHIVEPYENEVLYATLSDAGGFEKDMFRWKTALSYMEAR
jgi:hypothetical protein